MKELYIVHRGNYGVVGGEEYTLVQGSDNLTPYVQGYVIQRVDKLTRIKAELTLKDADPTPDEI